MYKEVFCQVVCEVKKFLTTIACKSKRYIKKLSKINTMNKKQMSMIIQ